MTLSAYVIEKTGEVFRYDNSLNTIVDMDGNPLGGFPKNAPRDPSFTKSNHPALIKILMGHACNVRCSYCLQSELQVKSNPSARGTAAVLAKRLKDLNLVQNKKEKIRIELWGGEPLLYWEDVVTFMTELNFENITWFISTNGILLDIRHVEFFKTVCGKVTLAISHDGPAHDKLRGINPLTPDIIPALTALEEAGIGFSFNTVVSRYNFDLFAINDYFLSFIDKNGLERHPICFITGRTHEREDNIENSHAVTKEQLPEYRDILKRFLHQHLEEHRQKLPLNKKRLLIADMFHFDYGVLGFAKSLKEQSFISNHSNCGIDDPHVISIDMAGNLRNCQNVGSEYNYGTIDDIENAVMKRVDYNRHPYCTSCPVLRLCNRSCPLDLSDAAFIANHQTELVFMGEIQLTAFELLFNSPITRLSEL